jgi:hypothetical protein
MTPYLLHHYDHSFFIKQLERNSATYDRYERRSYERGGS